MTWAVIAAAIARLPIRAHVPNQLTVPLVDLGLKQLCEGCPLLSSPRLGATRVNDLCATATTR